MIKRNKQGFLLFIIFGLPIYTSTLSIAFGYGLKDLVGFLQAFKEIIIIVTLGVSVWTLKTCIKFHKIDILIIVYFLYTLLYIFLPLGGFSFSERLIAFKSMSFFPLIYFIGRLFNPGEIYINKYFNYILIVAIAATGISILETVFNLHFQSISNYADYNYYFFDQEPTGNYGLTWTFEIENGQKRLASFFSNPLEHAAATLLALAIIASLYTNEKNRLRFDTFGKVALAATFISIVLALSRASFASYFLVIYVYALITGKKYLMHLFHLGFLAVIGYFLFLLQNEELYDFVINTITFQNESSVGHIIEWVAGIQAMISKPLGLGLGSSGRVSAMMGLNVGGENQFIIIGVQAGVIALLVYIIIHFFLIRTSYKWINHLTGKERKVAMALFLFKIGSIIPLFTANFDSYIYVTYISWFFSGLFVNMIAQKKNKEVTKGNYVR